MYFVSESNIFLNKFCLNKDDLFDFLSKISENLGISNNAEDVKKGLFDREKEGNTIIGDMIAMPHARSESIKELKVILVKLEKPIEYNKNENIDLVYSILAPLKSNNEFIDILSSVASIVQDDELQTFIRNSKNGDESKILLKMEEVLKNNA
ncbi:putative phosphotransferase system enzyme IIA [Brachyspira pilosicoli WesB]|uniref:Putative phosphotransferase system enzyme IIA n=1 Tax=Brachyspira pilosicoli WesB TaxID=1161918 RepID=K0JMY0_BRAPL|nr:PTS sugar transporter subunit IIA [Brachyspira pilosicoli]CCG57886.1 putative phosphotransferase system enzyme IIA [Brachyspira pilosicoli WesB]